MNKKAFINTEIKPSRVLKAVGLSLVCLISLFTVLSFGIESLLSLYQKYSATPQEVSKEVLGTEDKAEFTGSYGDYKFDEAVWDFGMDREGYYKLAKFIENPEYYLPETKGAINQTWILKGQNKLMLSCPDLSDTFVIAGDYHACTISYNGKAVNKSVRMTGTCDNTDKQTGCSAEVGFTVYSQRYGSSNASEYLITYEWASGSKDNIYVYRLKDGKADLLKFIDGDVTEDSWYISSYAFEMYGKYSAWENQMDFNDEIELVTMFHEPSMSSGNNLENIFKIWRLNDNKLERLKTIFDLYREGEDAHWL
ncbi:hypothetical protein IT417_03375 [bacterium]|nr:hypothetical protein [bacterium]